jgi:hypothetical protein
MFNKILSPVSIMMMIASLSPFMREAAAQKNDNNNKIFTYENSAYGIRMQYPSNRQKEENLSSGSDNNSMLVDVVKFISPTKNASDAS